MLLLSTTATIKLLLLLLVLPFLHPSQSDTQHVTNILLILLFLFLFLFVVQKEPAVPYQLALPRMRSKGKPFYCVSTPSAVVPVDLTLLTGNTNRS